MRRSSTPPSPPPDARHSSPTKRPPDRWQAVEGSDPRPGPNPGRKAGVKCCSTPRTSRPVPHPDPPKFPRLRWLRPSSRRTTPSPPTSSPPLAASPRCESCTTSLRTAVVVRRWRDGARGLGHARRAACCAAAAAALALAPGVARADVPSWVGASPLPSPTASASPTAAPDPSTSEPSPSPSASLPASPADSGSSPTPSPSAPAATSPESPCLSSDGAPSSVEPPAWDSPPLPPSACSLALGSYSPETAAELAAIRVSVVYGLGLLLLLTAATTVARWRR